MNKYLTSHEWSVIEEGFHPTRQKACESLFSLGNGHMGQRANFEESYSGESLQGSYIAGIYYPDKTRVGWWKNGYPEYFAKVLNSPNWIGIDVTVERRRPRSCDLRGARVSPRTQHEGRRRCRAASWRRRPGGGTVRVEALRFLSMATPRLAWCTTR